MSDNNERKMTLKQLHERKTRLVRLSEKLKVVDKTLVENGQFTRQEALILEAFDKQQMAAAVDIVKKLKTIDFGPLRSLAQGRDQAVQDVTRVLGGQNGKGLVRRIVGLFKGPENPLVDSIAYANALKNFFTHFTQYAAALGTGVDENSSLGAAVTGLSDEELGDIKSAEGKIGAEQKKKLADLQKVIINGMQPTGALAAVGKNWVDKYMKGKKGLQALANELIHMPLKDVNQLAQSIPGALKNVESVGQAAAGASQQGAVSSTGSTGSNTAASTSPAAGSVSTKSGATAPGAQVPQEKASSDVAQRAFDDLKDSDVGKNNGVSPNAMKAILAALEEKGYLK